MKKHLSLLLLISVVAATVSAQQGLHLVRLKDKNGSAYSLAQPSEFLSAKAILRRTKQKILIDSTDLPVNPAYIGQIKNISGVTLLSVSKWLNQALVETADSLALQKINALPFVLSEKTKNVKTIVNMTNAFERKFAETFGSLPDSGSSYRPRSINKATGAADDIINYGSSYNQVHLHEGEYLHNLGFRGEGISIAVIDAGFMGYKTNPALEMARTQGRIKGEYDFVNNEFSVDEDNAHGLYCLSIIGADLPGVFVGSAPKASFYLYRTENVFSESIAEEQFWAAAAEKADSVGADMISSSLGYINFDDPLLNHTYAQRNGNTAVITNAADLAAKKGMLVTISCGNSGTSVSDNKYVMCPGDADSVLTIGATNAAGVIANFSSIGPNGAGKLKPNVVSLGQGAAYVKINGEAGSGNGTSLSNPNLAGLIACLWEAFSEFSNMEIIDAVQKSADRYNNPDQQYGYGIPNFHVAYDLLQQKREANLQQILNKGWLKALKTPFRTTFTVLLKAPASGNAGFQFVDAAGRTLQKKNMTVQQDNYYYIDFTPPPAAAGIYYLHYSDGKNKTAIRLTKL